MGSRVCSLLLNYNKQQNKTARDVKNKLNARLKLTVYKNVTFATILLGLVFIATQVLIEMLCHDTK